MEKLKVLLIGFIQALANKVYKNEQFVKQITSKVINKCFENIKQEYKNIKSRLIKKGCDTEILNNLLEENDYVYQICGGTQMVKFIDQEYFSLTKIFNQFFKSIIGEESRTFQRKLEEFQGQKKIIEDGRKYLTDKY